MSLRENVIYFFLHLPHKTLTLTQTQTADSQAYPKTVVCCLLTLNF